jgi:glycosyltransferase involved in cell wall biosynthesis
VGQNSIFANLACGPKSSVLDAVVTNPTRVLYLAIDGKRIGGAQIQYEYLISGMDRSQYEPILLTRIYGEINEALARDGISTRALSYPLWRRKMLFVRHRARSRFVTFAQEQGVHLVHGDFELGPYLVAIAETLGIPAVLHVRQSVKRAWIRRYALLRASALIAIGNRYRDQLLCYGVPPERITVIPDATDLVRFTPERPQVLRQEHPVMSDDVLFGIVGRIEPFKRQFDFLRAAEQVVAAGRQARFFIVGAPNQDWPRYVRRVQAFPAACGIERRVAFTGPRSDIERVIASLDVLVTLSGGSVMLEAMACGVPVVTASDRSPAALEIVRDGETGLVVPADNPDALVQAMLRLCDDAGLRRLLGANGRRRVETQFGRARLVRETTDLYECLLTKRPAEKRERILARRDAPS